MPTDHQPSLFDKVGGPTGRSHPKTSQVAGEKVRSGSQQAQIILALDRAASFGEPGMTGYRLARHVFNGAGDPISANQACTRLGELRDRGLVDYVPDPTTRQPVEAATTPGNTGLLHTLTAAGFDQVLQLRLAAQQR